MPKKIDPLNKKNYGPITAMLIVSDVKAALQNSVYALLFQLARAWSLVKKRLKLLLWIRSVL